MYLNMATIKRKMDHATTVADLIETLGDLPLDAKVFFACDYGDHCHTEQALPITNINEMDYGRETIYESAYSRSGLAVRNADDRPSLRDEFDDWTGPKVVILR